MSPQTRIVLGIHVHAQPERLRATLAALERNTALDHDLVLLPDGPDEEILRELAPLNLRQLPDEGVLGTAACLNRLVKNTEAGIVVLIESGVVVGPRWLDHLVAALDSSPRAGLAGPSTNLTWNEQGAFPQAGGSLDEVARTAEEAERRFGAVRRTLAPLYSVGDFCYAVRREVFAAIGEADEGYGLGPCWEMDFNVRAARAGFDGLWAGAAYVWRAPFTPRREREEAARFEASRRRYQDRFCGARLRGEKHDYRAHCRGDACPDFAPRETAAAAGPAVEPAWPLVSCIMPTFDRRAFIPQAIGCFLAQDYPSLELVVVDDGNDPIADLLPSDPRIVYLRLSDRKTVGAKRNYACERARGEFIVHWDDDDWYPPSRVRVQIGALVERGGDVCGTSILYYYDRSREQAWCYQYSGGPNPWVGGNTLAYRREAWRRNPFPDMQIGEDAQFVWRHPPSRVVDLKDPGLCIAAVHASNISAKDTSGVYWSSERVERIRSIIAAGTPPSPPASATPLVSCIMPTYNRRSFIPLALACFREQSYANRELIVIDDGSDPVGDQLRCEPAVRYVRVDRRISIGAKRNLACAEARGEIVAHWDDDDWYSADRLAQQVAPILRGEAEITGLENRFVLQMPARKFWTIDRRLHRTMFVGDVHGGTLVFRRAIWTSGVRYPEIDLAEDAMFLQQATSRGRRLLRLDNPGSFVYLRHGSNAWRFETGTFLDPSGWSESVPPAGFSAECLEAYTAAAGAHTRQG
ncbi:MAG TPA: glycosyltransferase [Thermoanaerobaculia bacterium]|jgi:glycosyltransferase involved in cell wall biosynthesis|nr:glycosyltransferase [Thermoanaerobaculia bacterium]